MKALMLLCSLVTAIPAATPKAKVVGIRSGASLEILNGGTVAALKIGGIDCADRTHASGKAARLFVAETMKTSTRRCWSNANSPVRTSMSC